MSRDNYGKLWLQRLLNEHAIKRAQAEIQSTGRALPCVVQSVAGQIVTVTFDLDTTPWTLPPVTIPVATSIYDWIPVQPGDKGITLPGDVYLGALSGLGAGTATMKEPGNLSSLVFVPVANVSWSAPGGDAKMRVSQGPDGFLGQTSDGQNGVKIVAGTIYFIVGGTTIAYLDATGFFLTGNMDISGDISGGTGSGGGTASFKGDVSTTGAIVAAGNVTAGTIDLETHVHTGVTTGSGNTGGPTG